MPSSAAASGALSPAIPPPSSRPELDRALDRLKTGALEFARLPPRQKAALLAEVRSRFFELAPRMVELGCRARHLDPESRRAGEEWLSSPAISLRALKLFQRSLQDIAARGAPRIEGALGRSPDERLTVPLAALDGYDRVLFSGLRCEAWLERGVGERVLLESQASFYRAASPAGRVALVLGAGNVGSISVLDVLYHSFVAGGVCLLKMNPVNGYLGPLYQQAFAPLADRGFFAVALGGAEVGAYLAEHPAVDAIHVTGSVDTHDRIVWGPPGEDAERRKREGRPLTHKPITSELGNVSPALIVPARYTDAELDRMARSIAGMVVNNASFNCNALKLLVTARSWPQRRELLERVGRALAEEPARFAFYPGAAERHQRLAGAAAPAQVQHFGDRGDGRLPWTLIAGLEPDEDSPLFRIEPFCSLISETALDTGTTSDFLRTAVRFVNERVFGTLNAMLFVPDGADDDVEVARALDRALVELRYGTVGINVWPAVAYGLGAPPWGGAPGATLRDAQSGLGWGHDALMLERVHKVVITSRLLAQPLPFWVTGDRDLLSLGRALAAHEAAPSARSLLRAAWAGLRA